MEGPIGTANPPAPRKTDDGAIATAPGGIQHPPPPDPSTTTDDDDRELPDVSSDPHVVDVTYDDLTKMMQQLALEYLNSRDLNEAFRKLEDGELQGTVVADELLMLRKFRDAA